jgi:hypothetical protein
MLSPTAYSAGHCACLGDARPCRSQHTVTPARRNTQTPPPHLDHGGKLDRAQFLPIRPHHAWRGAKPCRDVANVGDGGGHRHKAHRGDGGLPRRIEGAGAGASTSKGGVQSWASNMYQVSDAWGMGLSTLLMEQPANSPNLLQAAHPGHFRKVGQHLDAADGASLQAGATACLVQQVDLVNEHQGELWLTG